MSAISRQSIQRLKEHVDLYDVVSLHVQLKRSGRNWVGLSPFTGEKTPSFYVLSDKQIFKCHSSGEAGDLFSFIQKVERVSFPEAVEIIAKRFNFELEYEKGDAREWARERSRRAELIEIHEYATEFFHRTFLADNEDGRFVREYWEAKRKFPLSIAQDFRIGLAPRDRTLLRKYLEKKNFSHEALAESGLFTQSGSAFFVGRLMIPIRDHLGEIVAFTARKLDITPEKSPAADAKYVNSQETPIFHKSKVLFNLDRARGCVSDDRAYLLVEGQLDAVRCWHCGLKTAVAPQGTSVTLPQLQRLRRNSERLEVLLDGDSAGQRAALRLLPHAFEAGLEVTFVVLPKGSDPDSFLAEHEAKGLEALRAQSQRAVPFIVSTLVPEGSDLTTRLKALRTIYELLAKCDSAVAQDAYFNEAVSCLDVDSGAARSDFRSFLQRQGRRSSSPAGETAGSTRSEPEAQDLPAGNWNTVRSGQPQRLTSAERELVWIVLQDVEVAAAICAVMEPVWIRSYLPEGRLLLHILAEIDAGNWAGRESMELILDNDSDRDLFFKIMVDEWHCLDLVQAANQCLARLFQIHLREQLKSLSERLQHASDPDAAGELLRERKQLQELKSRGTPMIATSG